MEKISAYTILYYDLQFYEKIIELIYNYVDEIIIVDGPYSYAIDTLKKFNYFYDESNKPEIINEILKKYPKIKYKYIICNNEEEKRIIGYNLCRNNLVLLVDTDEFLDIDINKLNNFILNKNKFVGCFDIFNMCDYNVNFNPKVQKYILFKKEKISALEHLDYTWLVGCKQNEKKIDYMDFKPNGTIYHLTLYRNKFNNITKFIFYVLLNKKLRNLPFNLFDIYDNDYLLSILSINEILDIFVHSRANSINIPSQTDSLMLLNDNKIIIDNKKYNNLSNFYFKKEMKCLKNITVNFRLEKFNQNINIILENVKNIQIKLYYLYINDNVRVKEFNFINFNNRLILENDLNSNEKYIYIELICNETINNEPIFKIKNIF